MASDGAAEHMKRSMGGVRGGTAHRSRTRRRWLGVVSRETVALADARDGVDGIDGGDGDRRLADGGFVDLDGVAIGGS